MNDDEEEKLRMVLNDGHPLPFRWNFRHLK
jgi:hypothetical protein